MTGKKIENTDVEEMESRENIRVNQPESCCARSIHDEHLKLLSIFYYILGGINAFFSFIPLIYVGIGGLLLGLTSAIPVKPGEPSPAVIGWVFILIGAFIFFFILALSLLKIYAGYCIAKRRHRVFCYVVAVLTCLSFPYGTVLGVFTFIVLSREAVIEQFSG